MPLPPLHIIPDPKSVAIEAYREQYIQARLEALYSNTDASEDLRRTCARVSRERMGGKPEELSAVHPGPRTHMDWKVTAIRMLQDVSFKIERFGKEHSPWCAHRCAPQWVRDKLRELAKDAVNKAIDKQDAHETSTYAECWDEAFRHENDDLWELVLNCYRPDNMNYGGWVSDLLIDAVLQNHQPIDAAEIDRTDLIRHLELHKPGFYSFRHLYRHPLTKDQKNRIQRRHALLFIPIKPETIDQEVTDDVNHQLNIVPILLRHLIFKLMNLMLRKMQSRDFERFEIEWKTTYPSIRQPLRKTFLKEWIQDFVLMKWTSPIVSDRAEMGYHFEKYSPFYIFGFLPDDDSPYSQLERYHQYGEMDALDHFDSRGPTGLLCRGMVPESPPESLDLVEKFQWKLDHGADSTQVYDFLDILPGIRRQIEEGDRQRIAQNRCVQKELRHYCPFAYLHPETSSDESDSDGPKHESVSLGEEGGKMLQEDIIRIIQLNQPDLPSKALQTMLQSR